MKRKLHIEKQNIDIDQLIYKIGSYHFNWHNNLELFWLISGKIEMNVNGNSQVMEKNDMILINANNGHATFALKPNSVAMRIYISPEFFMKNGYDLNQGYFELNSIQERYNFNFQSLREAMASLYLYAEDSKENLIKINKYLFSIFDLITQFYHKNKKKKLEMVAKGKPVLDNVVGYIESHYTEDINLNLLARKFNYSSSYLSKLFKTELGLNFYEYLTRYRLIYAIKDLTNSELKVSDIAFRNGFSDVKSFNSMFKKHFQQTPSAYRKQVNRDLKIVDEKFKDNLSFEDEKNIKSLLRNLALHDKKRSELENPCSTCMAKGYEQKYNGLVKNIKEILPN
ncbi:AraC family transcriptional regulator [Tetragenococcus halophilus]|uniref:AraC family transcriptional regulator n=1 Tax=Tetragenococcus halophilus TaxID=51669 RepID=UPI001F3EEEC0|nr:AraC family transcriptional regulator [Tetragenococcus halophilus]MCF1600837.1 AraC family transcriptional regulator [Tetragenococcus halophilus]